MSGVQSFEQSIELGQRSLDLLREFQTPAVPRYYELFYAYAAGGNQDLNSAMEALRSSERTPTETDALKLYETYVSPEKPEAKLEKVGQNLSDELNEIIALVHSASNSTEVFSESLQRVGAQLGQTTDPDQLKAVLHTLVTATKKMAENSHELEDRLADSKRQISDLQKNLETVRIESHTDPLTGVANRKFFDQALGQAIQEARTGTRPLCLLMVDIDHFKKFNDLYGHQTGDGVLKLVARAMKANVKGRDVLARYGGEEFSIVLKSTSLQGATVLAEQIRRAVMSKELVRKSTGQNLGRITLSIGVAVFKPGETAESFIARADACLYAAKHLGRNCIKAESDPAIRKKLNNPRAA